MTEPAAQDSSVAVPLPPDAQIRTVLGDSYDPETTLNVVKMFAGAGDLAPPIAALVEAIFKAQGVDPKAREVITLRAAKNLGCAYEWQANTTLAQNVGLSEEQIAAIGADGPLTDGDDEHVLLCRATDELCHQHTLSDQTLQAILARYDDTTARKLLLMISWFNMLSLFLNGCRVPLETSDKVGDRTSPL